MSSPFILSDNILDASFITLLFCATVFPVVSREFKSRGNASSGYVLFFCVMIGLFSIFGNLDLDYHNYKDSIRRYFIYGSTAHIEPIYFYIADFTGSFFAWRCFLWGIATILMMNTILRLRLSYLSTYLFIIIFYAFSFYKLRSSLGISLLFWGVSYLLVPIKRHQILSFLIGMLAIISSYWFHKSMPVCLAILFFAWIIPFNRKFVTCSLIAFPFLVTAVSLIIKSYSSIQISVSDGQLASTLASGAGYASASAVDKSVSSIFGIMRMTISYLPAYLGLFIVTRDTVYLKISLPRNVNYLFKFWFLMTYFASLFFSQQVAFWMYIRFLTMSYFPMALVLGYYFKIHRYTLLMKLLLALGTLSILFDIFYPLYKRFLE